MATTPLPARSTAERMASVMTKEELDLVSWLVRDCARRLKAGKAERYSEAKTVANRKNAEIARALKIGDQAEADRLRWKYYPAKMRKLEMERAIPPKQS